MKPNRACSWIKTRTPERRSTLDVFSGTSSPVCRQSWRRECLPKATLKRTRG
nr:MAG TPA: hypothetical protein [Caudoviricetes sp.]